MYGGICLNKRFIEKTLVLIKPDAVARGISGSIIKRFENSGLKIVGLKIVNATKEQLDHHFPIEDKAWIIGMGEKSLGSYKLNNLNPIKELGTDDPFEIGKIILEWNYEYLLSGPLIAMVLEGVYAVNTVRKMIGHTIPAIAQPGTIRGDYSINSADYSNSIQHSCKNVVHASGSVKEAEIECSVWFNKDEIVEYKRADTEVMY